MYKRCVATAGWVGWGGVVSLLSLKSSSLETLSLLALPSLLLSSPLPQHTSLGQAHILKQFGIVNPVAYALAHIC